MNVFSRAYVDSLFTEVHNAAVSQDIAIQQDRVDQLIRGYRVRGHLSARIDLLGRTKSQQRAIT